MNRSFIVAVLTVTMIVMMSTAGHAAIAPPHNLFACDNCHGRHTGTTALAATNGCIACHSILGEASRMPIDADAMSNYYGSVAGQPPKGSQSTHNYLDTAPYDPRAKSLEPTNASLNTGYSNLSLANTVYCIRCHNAKSAFNSTPDVNKPFLRVTNANDALCLDCHRQRNTTTHTTGSHPVAYRVYSTVYKLNTTAYRKIPRNANVNNPTSDLGKYLKGGKIVCMTCHAPHYADSSSATLDNRSTANGFAQDNPAKGLKGRMQESKGQLLRTDPVGGTADSINVCSSCHKETANLNHNGKGQNIQCDHCHSAHVDYTADGSAPNQYLVRNDFSNMSTTKVKLGANVKAIYNTATSLRFARADGKGICQVCHIPTPGVAIHDLTDTRKKDCLECHKHSNGFSALNCNACHGQPPITSYVGGPNGKASQAYTIDESFTAHATHADSGYYKYACKNCHYDGTKPGYHNTQSTTGTATFASVFIDTTGSVGDQPGLIKNIPTDYNATTKTCSNVYCHSNGNPRGGTIAWKSANTPAWDFGKNKILGQAAECTTCHESGNTLVTNAHYAHVTTNSIKCYVCHSATVSSTNAIVDRTKHVNGIKDVTFVTRPENFKSIFNASFDKATATCTASCHTNGIGFAPISTPKWTVASTGKCGKCHLAVPNTTLHPLHFSGTTGPKLGANPDCASCHNYSAGAVTHANGVVDMKPGNSCSPCHPASAGTPIWSVSATVTCESCHTGTASVILSQGTTYTAPLKSLTAGHSVYSSASYKHVRCTSCHNDTSNHIGAGPLEKRLLVAGNALCDTCHTTASGKGLPAARIDLLVHGGANPFNRYTTTADSRASSCAGCHDTHGTTNLFSIRTLINGQAIVYTDRSLGFYVSSPNGNGVYNGLCQVCHTKTKYFRRNLPPSLGHATKDCLSCHLHKSVTGSPVTFAFQGAGGCNKCHGYPPTRSMTGLGTMGNYSTAVLQDYSGGGGAHTVAGHIPRTTTQSDGWSSCSNCHYNTAHNQGGTPVQKSFVNVIVNPKFKFRNDTSITYNASTCSNVSCHFRPSPNWTTGQ